MSGTRGQAWGFDLLIASIIFIAGLILFFLYSMNLPTETEEHYSTMFSEGISFSELILSEGTPQDWNQSNIIRPGIFSSEKINETKLIQLTEMSASPAGYEKIRSLSRIHSNFYINFSEPITLSNGSEISEIGKPFSPDSPNIVGISRFAQANNKPISMRIYLWE